MIVIFTAFRSNLHYEQIFEKYLEIKKILNIIIL